MLGHTRDLPLATPGDQLAAGAFSVTKNPVPIRRTGSKILIVVVRYLTPLQESQTIQTLCSGLAGDLELERNVSTLIWDNSPAPQSVSELPIQVEYRHSDENVGVAGAYNYAMELAEQRGFRGCCCWTRTRTFRRAFCRRCGTTPAGLKPIRGSQRLRRQC